MSWQSPALSYRCGACGTTVTGFVVSAEVLIFEREHAKVCKRTGLAEWHDERGFGCAAHSEGQECCVDLWLKETEPPTTESEQSPDPAQQ